MKAVCIEKFPPFEIGKIYDFNLSARGKMYTMERRILNKNNSYKTTEHIMFEMENFHKLFKILRHENLKFLLNI